MSKKNIADQTDEQLEKAQTTAQKGKSITLGMLVVYVLVLAALAIKGLYAIALPLSVVFMVLIASYASLHKSLQEIDDEQKKRAGAFVGRFCFLSRIGEHFSCIFIFALAVHGIS